MVMAFSGKLAASSALMPFGSGADCHAGTTQYSWVPVLSAENGLPNAKTRSPTWYWVTSWPQLTTSPTISTPRGEGKLPLMNSPYFFPEASWGFTSDV